MASGRANRPKKKSKTTRVPVPKPHDPLPKPRPSLPFDVVYQVSQYLDTHRRTLRAISLTCRVWRDAVRSHLFRRITLSDTDSFERFRALVDAQPHMLRWIYEVYVSGRKEAYGIPEWLGRFSDIFPPEKIPKLRGFGFVELQEAYGAPWDYVALAETLPKLSVYTTVTSLAVLDCMLPYDVFQAISGAFPELTDQHVHGTRCSAPHPQRPLQNLNLPVKLSTLKLHGYGPSLIQSSHCGLRRSPVSDYTEALGSLRVLHYNVDVDEWLMNGIGKILALGTLHKLRHLGLLFPTSSRCFSQNIDAARALRLCDLPRLRTIYMGCLVPCIDANAYFNGAIPYLLRELQHEHLRTIVVALAFTYMGDFMDAEFSSVDSHLATGILLDKLPALKEVRFVYHGNLSPAKYTAKIKRMFPRLKRAGVLTIASGSEQPPPDSQERCL
ncbi:hypothetical protein EIP91_009750 [Steccherinum ochraceum]|uniref:F-box domain-containing protein n=1 Tax=Steccherinum ochraceum TaxID=92696 RepID=A0A4R0R3X5_9APHY|nr:hypothetical protein EIP91_009750 [Steccherinum ochraceum]